jgi:hypothetical protein
MQDTLNKIKEQSSMWVITFSVNAYDQEGDYLDMVFDYKPTKEELDNLGYDGEHLLKGGGRKSSEEIWYHLKELKSGELYKHSISR